jgi:copper chaperone
MSQAPAQAASSETVFAVPDMNCSHCEATVRKALGAAFPAESFSIDLAGKKVSVRGDSVRAVEILRDAGYEATPLAK